MSFGGFSDRAVAHMDAWKASRKDFDEALKQFLIQELDHDADPAAIFADSHRLAIEFERDIWNGPAPMSIGAFCDIQPENDKE